MGGYIGSTKTAAIRDYEIRVARLYVQDRLSIGQIAERLGGSSPKVVEALKRVGIRTDPDRRYWATF